MYHELTEEEIAQRKRRRVFGIALAVVLLALAIWGAFLLQANARSQGAASLRETILNSAKQCCAVEGSYPSTLAHLENMYGLTINHNDYVITYEWFADNVPPSVVVIPR